MLNILVSSALLLLARGPQGSPGAEQAPGSYAADYIQMDCGDPRYADECHDLKAANSQLLDAFHTLLERVASKKGVDAEYRREITKNIAASQDSWLTYRDSQCRAIETAINGAFRTPAILRCLTDLTRLRMANLGEINDWLQVDEP